MRYGSIKSRIHEFAGLPEGGEFENLVDMSANAVYQRLLLLVATEHEVREFSLTTVASTGTYGLPLNVQRLIAIEDTTARKILFDVTQQEFLHRYPGTITTGIPDNARPFGSFGVQKQPAVAGLITLVSSSTADDGANFIVVLTGFDSSGNRVRQEVTMDGTTNAASTVSFTTLERVVKAPASGNTFTGSITVKDSSSNILTVIPTWWESPEHIWIEFYPIPAAAETYILSAEMRMPPLVEDEDWPEIESGFHDLIWRGVIQDLFPKIGLSIVSDKMRDTLDDRMDEFLEFNGAQPVNRTLVFANVWSESGNRQRSNRPRISGVDFV